MKKYLYLLPAMIFPYLVVLSFIILIWGTTLMLSVFHDNGFLLIGCLLLFWVVALGCVVLAMIASHKKTWDPLEMARMNRICKLVQIPAYVLIYIFGAVCFITIFSSVISVVLCLLDCMAIFLSGLWGAWTCIKSYRCNKIDRNMAVLYGLCQFLFCFDIYVSIMLVRRIKKKQDEEIVFLEGM